MEIESKQFIKNTLLSGAPEQQLAVFRFDSKTKPEKVALKFRLWGRFFFARFFKFSDAPFHEEMDLLNAKAYLGDIDAFLNIVFRGGAKTTRTKLFVAFVILNDSSHLRRFIKMLSRDGKNSTQFVTDIYNFLVDPRIRAFYQDTFLKTDAKREETMSSFTTSFGVKMLAGTVGSSQRGQIQDDARPDLIIFDDFEDRTTLRSAVITQAIFDNCEEARTGLAKNGACIYLGNYISERGNVHRLVQKIQNKLIIPIIKDGVPTWNAYTVAEINTIKSNTDDFAGEYLCEPSAGLDIFFDRECLERQKAKQPLREVAGFKQFYNYDPSHRYGSGHDVAGGVGLDHSTSVFIDFHTIPNRVVATFKSNTIKPDVFGYEIIKECGVYGNPVCAIENNKFDMAIGVLKHQGYDNIYFTEEKETRAGIAPRTKYWGWNTNTMTKPKMLFDLKKAVEDGHLELTDEDLISELRSYTRDDLMDRDEDVRLTTRHFDLLISAAIAYQMRNWAVATVLKSTYQQPAYQRAGLDE